MVETIHSLFKKHISKRPNAPAFLIAAGDRSLPITWRQFGRDIDGLILSGSPGFNPAVKAALALTQALTLFHGGRRARSGMLAGILNGQFAKKFPGGSPFAWLSANADNVKKYEADPLCGFPFTLNGYRALLNLMIAAYDKKTSIRRSLPVHFISGADDPCAPDEKGFLAAAQNLRDRGCAEVTSKLYPGLRHEILNEGVQEVRDDLLETILNMAKRA